MKINRETIETIINYKHVASKDETRPYLNAIGIGVIDKDLLEIVATDGYKAIKSTHQVIDCKLPVDKNNHYLVSTKDIKALSEYLKRYKTHNTFEVNILIDTSIIEIKINKHADMADSLTFRLIDRDYVKINAVYPIKLVESKKTSITFNPNFIMDLRKAIYGSRVTKNESFTLKFQDDLKPIIINVKHNGIDHNGLIMPIKDKE